MNRKDLRPWIILGISILSASFGSTFSRYAVAGGMSAIGVAFLRMSAVTLILAPLVLLSPKRRKELRSFSKKELLISVLAGVFLALHFTAWFTAISVKELPMFQAVLLCNTQPIFVVIFSYLLLKEKINKKALIGLLIAIAASSLIALSSAQGSGTSVRGIIAALFTAIFYCFYIICGRRVLRRDINITAYTFLIYGVCAGVLLGFTVFSGAKTTGYPVTNYLAIGAMVFCNTFLGHTMTNLALKYLPTAIVSISSLLELGAAAVLGIVLFNEIPSITVILGSLLLVCGIVLFNLSMYNGGRSGSAANKAK